MLLKLRVSNKTSFSNERAAPKGGLERKRQPSNFLRTAPTTPNRPVPSNRKVPGSGTVETLAENVTPGFALDSTKVPPLVRTGESVHWKITPGPVIGPIEVFMAQEENAGFVGPSIRSAPRRPARENPTV